MSFGPVRLDGDRPTEDGDRLFELSLIVERIAEVVLRLGQVGLDGDRPAVGGDRCVELSLSGERIAEATKEIRIPSVALYGLTDQCDR